MTTGHQNHPIRKPPRRQKLHLIYFLLAAFDLVTVTLSLYLIDRIMGIYEHSVQMNEVWADRLSDYSELSQLAVDVNTPGNDVFQSRDVSNEAALLEQAHRRFMTKLDAVRADLASNIDPEHSDDLLRTCDRIEQASNDVVTEAQGIFASFGANQPQRAGERMAAMDRHYARLNATLAGLGQQVRDLQQTFFNEQAAEAASLRRSELLIASFIFLMVLGVTIYGHHLARQMKLSARRREEDLAALSASEARLSAIFASALDPIVTINDDGLILDASDSVERVFGWRPAELIGQDVRRLIPESFQAPHEQALARARETGRLDKLGHTRELEAIHKDGSTFPIEISISAVDETPDHAALFTGIIHDLTRRKQDEEAVKTSEARLQAILDNTTAVVYLKDRDSRYLLVNRRFEELFDVHRDQVVGKSVFDLFPAETARMLKAHDQQVIQSRRPLEFEELVPHDGTEHTYLSVKFPLYDAHGQSYAVCGISTDITQRKRQQEELAQHRDRLEELVAARTEQLRASNEQLRIKERLAAIGTLAAGLGHDMNNVLFPMRCRLEVLQSGDVDDAAQSELTAIEQSVDYLQQLSNGLRLLVADPQRAHGTTRSTQLNKWWCEVQGLFEAALPRRAKLVCDLPENLPALAAPVHRITQAIFNLVLNAGEAMRDAGTVHISARSVSRRMVEIIVRDDGPGMSADQLRQARDPFFTTKKRSLSTGLGLALVHGVVESVGGTLDIISAPNQGTSVTMTLPIVDISEDSAMPARDAQVASLSVADQHLAAVVTALLRSAGYEVRGAADCEPSGSLWITEDGVSVPSAARSFVADSSHRHVIVFTDNGRPGWSADGITFLDRAAGFPTIRQAIEDAGEQRKETSA